MLARDFSIYTRPGWGTRSCITAAALVPSTISQGRSNTLRQYYEVVLAALEFPT